MKKKGLTARQVQHMKADPDRRLEVPAGKGLYLVVHPTGRKTWAFRYRWDGGHKKLTLEDAYPDMRLAAARAEVEAAHEDLKDGIDPAAEKEELKTHPETPKEVVAEFVHRQLGGTKTQDEMERIFRVYVLPHCKHRLRVGDITRPDILRIVDRLTDRGTPVMANRVLKAVKQLLKWCAERGYIEASPVAGIRAPNREKSRDRVLSPEELVEVWHGIEGLGYPLAPFFQIIILTGQRRGEVARLRWQDLDLEAGLWTMKADKTKSGRIHDVPLSDQVLDILRNMGRFEGGFAFSTTSGQRPISGFSKAKVRLGDVMLAARRETDPDATEMEHWTVHDLRRTAATHMAGANVPPHVLSAILGHSPGRTMGISAVYIRHQYLDERRAALEAWGAYVLDLVRPARAAIK